MRLLAKYSLILILVASCVACSQPTTDKSKTFANGDVARLVSANHLVLKNSQGQVLQDSTFTKPSFEQAKKKLKLFQKNIAKKNKMDFISRDIVYPLRVNSKGKTRYFKNIVALKMAFTKVFTPTVQQAILKQDPFRLFANYQGVMIADGMVWFNNKGIIAVNH